MTVPIETASTHPRSLLRSAGAVIVGFVVVFVLSLGTDQVLHVLNVYPPWGQPMFDPGLNLLALTYRIVYTIFGAYITAKLAPHSPMGHALVLGAIGFAVATAGAVVAITQYDLGPDWYPIALALTALPCAWAGAALYLSRHPAR
jgi:hypothetical protein